MAETLQNLYLGFAIALSPGVLVYGVLGCVVGTLVGVLPGVGPLAGISLLLPLTFGLDATRALVMLAGIYYGAMYGGSTTSILMRIPGEAASVVSCIDGYAMARKGRAGPALAIAAVGSYVAGTVSVVALMLLAPPLAEFALRFGPPEFFALLLLGLLVLAYMNPGSMLDGLGMAALGLLLGMIGIDQMSGHLRYGYGVPELADGIGVVPVAVGLFGLGEILLTAGQPQPPEVIRRACVTCCRRGWSGARRTPRSGEGPRWGSSSGSSRARRTSSRRSSRTPSSVVSRGVRRSSATAPWPAWPGRSPPTTRRPPAPSCRCWRSACRGCRSRRCCWRP